jgi:hypothetical protein
MTFLPLRVDWDRAGGTRDTPIRGSGASLGCGCGHWEGGTGTDGRTPGTKDRGRLQGGPSLPTPLLAGERRGVRARLRTGLTLALCRGRGAMELSARSSKPKRQTPNPPSCGPLYLGYTPLRFVRPVL